MCLFVIHTSSLLKYLFKSLPTFLLGCLLFLLHLENSLCILDKKKILIYVICRYFFQVSKYYALNCVFWWQEFLILIKSSLTSLWFVILMWYLKHFALLKVTEISSCLLIEALYFGVLHLGLWFILSQFLYGVKYELRFILLHMNVQYSYSSTICWEKYSFSTELPFQKYID